MYCQARGIGVPNPTTYAFCQALSMFRIAAILAGVGARAQLGNASSKHAAEVSHSQAVWGWGGGGGGLGKGWGYLGRQWLEKQSKGSCRVLQSVMHGNAHEMANQTKGLACQQDILFALLNLHRPYSINPHF